MCHTRISAKREFICLGIFYSVFLHILILHALFYLYMLGNSTGTVLIVTTKNATNVHCMQIHHSKTRIELKMLLTRLQDLSERRAGTLM